MALAKTRTKKIIVAGSLVVEAIYPRITTKDGPAARAAKSKASSEAQKRMNRIYSYQKLELLIAANFRPGDLLPVFTYAEEYLPASRKEASDRLKAWRRKFSAARILGGQELKMIWNTEHKHGEGRWHHHSVVNACGDDFELIQKLWPWGRVEIRELKIDKDHSYEGLARYMAKEGGDKIGQRSWSYTRNLQQPEVETFRVEENTTVRVPKGGISLLDQRGKDQYSAWQVVKYLAPGWDKHDRPRARRRRRR